MLRAADALTEIRAASEFGISISEPQVDLPAVMRRRDKVVATLSGGVGGLFTKNGIELIEGEASLASPGQVSVGGQTLTAKTIVIATAGDGDPHFDPGPERAVG